MNKKTIKIILTNEIELIPNLFINKKTRSLKLDFLFIKLVIKL